MFRIILCIMCSIAIHLSLLLPYYSQVFQYPVESHHVSSQKPADPSLPAPLRTATGVMYTAGAGASAEQVFENLRHHPITVKIYSKDLTTSVSKKKDRRHFHANTPLAPVSSKEDRPDDQPQEHSEESIQTPPSVQTSRPLQAPPSAPSPLVVNPFGPLKLPSKVVGQGFFPRDYIVHLKIQSHPSCISIASIMLFEHKDPKPYLDNLVKKSFEKQVSHLPCISPDKFWVLKTEPPTDIVKLTIRFYDDHLP
jgi:hypothetical protein